MIFDNMKNQKPSISIIIPTYNRPQKLAMCLDSLTKLDYPKHHFEVIVVDDGSKIDLEPVIEPFKNQLELTLLKIDNSGPANARNRGAELAKGSYLAFTDDDCQPATNWLNNFAARFAVSPNCLVGGKTLNALPANLYSTASQELTEYLYDYYHLINPKQVSFFASNNFALPKEKFLQIGGFDISFTAAASEDRELCDRWLNSNYPMIYAPEIQIYHAHDLTLFSFLRQHFNYGRGAFDFHQIREARQAPPIEVEPKSFYFNMLSYPFSKKLQQPRILVSSLFFTSQFAGAVGFFWRKLNCKYFNS